MSIFISVKIMKANPCLIISCKSERWTSMYIVSKQVSVFLESASRVYELIWTETSL